MGPEKSKKNVRKIVPTYTPTEFKLEDTAADNQRRRDEREQREKKQGEKQQRDVGEEVRRSELHRKKFHRWRRHWLQKDQEQRVVNVKWTQRLEERQVHLLDSDEEATVDFVKDLEQLYVKTHNKFTDKARKDCLWERFTSSRNISLEVCQTWF